MYKLTSLIAVLGASNLPSLSSASHLDNTNGIFDSYSFDNVKFKTRTNCSLDKYPEVSISLWFYLGRRLKNKICSHR